MVTRPSGSWWIQNLLRPVLIAAMMICLAVPLVQGIEVLIGDWDGTYFLVFLFLAGLEGIFSERVLQVQRVDGYGYLGSRAAELTILLLLLKLASYVPRGLDRLWTEAQTWTSVEQFVTIPDLLTAVAFVPLWAGAILVSRHAMQLDADEPRVAPPPDKTSTEYYLWQTQPSLFRERDKALNWLGETFMWGGVVLLIASTLIFALLPTATVPAIPTLLYFVLGVALLSQARFSVTRAGWQAQGIQFQAAIGRRWLLWAAIFLVGIALLARMLPTEYALGPVLALYYLIVLVAQGFTLLVTLIIYAVALLLSFVLPSVELPQAPPLTLQSPLAAQPAPANGSLPWLDTVLSALFWVVILAIVGYALFRFVQDRLGLLERDQAAHREWWGRLLAWLRDLSRRWRTGWRGLEVRLARRRTRKRAEKPVAARLSRFFSLRRLAPRDLVRYFYLSAARRAAQAGQPRGPGQTPYEYEADLEGRFPDLEPDLSELTASFVEARYSHRPVARAQAEAAKGPWQRIKAALRRRRVVRR
jgi:hypothetical protein